MKSIGIFCGSSAGEHPLYLETARLVGRTLAQQGLALVYGGGKVGLMGAVGRCGAGGRWRGDRRDAARPGGAGNCHRGLTELHVVEDMHERKTKMAALADGFIALPGGAGTLEEIFEQWTWAQLGIHEKPCAFLNIKGYYDPLQAMVDNMVREGFMHPRYAEMLPFATSADEIIAGFRDYTPPARKWVQQPAI